MAAQPKPTAPHDAAEADKLCSARRSLLVELQRREHTIVIREHKLQQRDIANFLKIDIMTVAPIAHATVVKFANEGFGLEQSQAFAVAQKFDGTSLCRMSRVVDPEQQRVATQKAKARVERHFSWRQPSHETARSSRIAVSYRAR